MLGANTTLAAGDCFAAPTRPPGPGGHWYFRLDRAKNRNCWYLVEPDVRRPTAEAPQPPAEPAAQPFGSLFSLMGLSSPATGPQPDPANNPGRIGETARPDDPRNDGATQGSRPRMTRHPDAQAALTPKPRRPPPARPPADHADEQPASSPERAERDALFQEFLRWRDRKPQ
jgi:hypothetical protein